MRTVSVQDCNNSAKHLLIFQTQQNKPMINNNKK